MDAKKALVWFLVPAPALRPRRAVSCSKEVWESEIQAPAAREAATLLGERASARHACDPAGIRRLESCSQACNQGEPAAREALVFI